MPLIDDACREALYACIAGAAHEEGCNVVRIGGMPDHVHALVRVHGNTSVSRVAKSMKGRSSHHMTHVLKPADFFKWQRTYGAFSVSPNEVERVTRYIDGQEEHHAHGTAVEEWERSDAR